MGLTLDLPPALEDELARTAKGEAISPSEHATLLISFATALLSKSRDTPFLRAVRESIAARSRHPDALGSALEELHEIFVSCRHDLFPLKLAEASADGADPKPEIGVRRTPSARGKYAHLKVSTEDVHRGHQEDIALDEKGWE